MMADDNDTAGTGLCLPELTTRDTRIVSSRLFGRHGSASSSVARAFGAPIGSALRWGSWQPLQSAVRRPTFDA
jgi:hypothetical protein